MSWTAYRTGRLIVVRFGDTRLELSVACARRVGSALLAFADQVEAISGVGASSLGPSRVPPQDPRPRP